MKKYDSIVKRVQVYEDKYCAEYQKSDGPLFRFLRKSYVIVCIYAVIVNILAAVSAKEKMDNWKEVGTTEIIFENHQFVLIWICTATIIISAILLFTRIKMVASIVGIVTLPFMLYVFMGPSTDEVNGFLGYMSEFYYRHLVPDAILMLFILWMFILVLRERIITNRRYRKIEENIYENYKEKFDKNDFVVTDEMWEEFIKNYDPRAFKNLDKDK